MDRAAAGEAERAITAFLEAARDPALIEPGEEPFPLREDSYSLEWRGGRLTIQVWDETRNLARRLVAVREQTPGRLELVVERFARREGQISFVDRARAHRMERESRRLVFRDQFRQFLRRRFTGWRLAEISAEPNLEESLSPAYPRAFLVKGATGWAAMAAPPEPGAASGVLTFALIWLDYLRRREQRRNVEGVALFLPESEAKAACLRIPFLNPSAAQFTTFVYSKEGLEDRLDPRDCGNLETRLDPVSLPSSAIGPAEEWAGRLCAIPGVSRRQRPDGGASLHVRGLEFARLTARGLLFGLERKQLAADRHLAEVEALAREAARLRSPRAPDRAHPLFRLQPEGWLESELRSHLERIDPSLLPNPLYNQVPAAAGGNRAVMDLLAADREGRLAVIELKASEDIQLPMQSLDYWMRVKFHLDSGEFTSRGYFPGIPLRSEWPRLLLVAPALDFHPKTETILRFFAPGIDVERIGLAADWRERIEVMFRIRGAGQPYL